MILCIADLLSADECASLLRALEGARYESGAATAGWHARAVKQNLQVAGDDAALREAGETVRRALLDHELFRMGVLPRAVRRPLFSRYEPGMGYGTHVDDAVMGAGDEALRTDVAVTVFLNAPTDCDGGELVIESAAGEQAYKLPSGAAIAYPATTLHRVEPVNRGVRQVAVTWVQSRVRDAQRRELLFDLDLARREVFDTEGKTPAFDRIAKSHANLLRLWADA